MVRMSFRTQKAVAAQKQRELQSNCVHEYEVLSQRPVFTGKPRLVLQRHGCAICSKQVTAQKRVPGF